MFAVSSFASAQSIPVFTPAEVVAVTTEQNAAGVNGVPIFVDGTTPTGQAFIHAMFTGTPFNATNTPMLMRVLGGTKAPPAAVKTTTQLGAVQDGQVTDLVDIVDVSNDGAGNVTASGLISTAGGAQFVHASLVLIDSQTREPLGPISYTSDPQGKLVTVNASGKLKPGSKALAVLLATISPTACAPSAVECRSRLGANSHAVAGLPAHLSASTYAQAAFADVGISPKRRPVVLAPVKVRAPSSGDTQVCLGRTPTPPNYNTFTQDCDYADPPQGPTATPRLRLPVAGSVDLNAPVPKSPKVTLFKMYVVPATGGACSTYNTTNASSVLTPINNGNTIEWNLGLKSTNPVAPGDGSTWAQFGTLSQNQYACWTAVGGPIQFSLQFKVVDINGNEVIAQVNDFGQQNANTTVVTPIKLAYGCVAEGTLVKMGDGSNKPIEQVQVGDMIVGAGSVRRVAQTYLGYEAMPLVQITTASGVLKLTEGHPVVLANGSTVTAKSVKKGDSLRDAAGKPVVVRDTSLLKSAQPVRVRNLSVEPSEQGAAPLTDAQHTFVAAGLVIGDNTLQEHIQQQAAAPRSLKAPPGWEKEAQLARRLQVAQQNPAAK